MAAVTLLVVSAQLCDARPASASAVLAISVALPFSRNGLGLTTGLSVGAIVSMVIAVQTTSGGNSQRRVPAVDSSL
jgi:hypothetical protein